MDYGFWTRYEGPFDDAVERVTEELQKEGFGILTEIDVKATLKKKLDVDRAPYKILGACNPQLANQALQAVPDIGLLLPCNVVVRENDDGSVDVGFLDPGMMSTLVEGDIEAIATDARARLDRVRDALAG
ncbi:MAG: DUF302 domain-containing protein [Gammaproteobacteria bacterium]|nr:DUF302 domain-containing protein [Gammaproteobacteria bacterium]